MSIDRSGITWFIPFILYVPSSVLKLLFLCLGICVNFKLSYSWQSLPSKVQLLMVLLVLRCPVFLFPSWRTDCKKLFLYWNYPLVSYSYLFGLTRFFFNILYVHRLIILNYLAITSAVGMIWIKSAM